uniref:Uncharacterized protein n=1 Tax=Tanacetum cinerariifolium TaxID=118510 RepID=A0A699H1W7_TANCI|nr:hypothetical protein [Tanacetum cinerariifolium]
MIESRKKVRVLKLRSLQKVRTSQRVETSDNTVMDGESNQERMIAEMDQDNVVVLEDDKEEDKDVVNVVKDVVKAKVDGSAQVQGRQAESQAKIYKIDMDYANKVLSMQEDETEPVSAAIPAILTAAPERVAVVPSRRRKGVIIRDPKEESTTSTIIPAETESNDKAVKRYQAIKRKPQTEAQARKNTMMYLKNIAGYKMDYFKGMSYDDIRPIFERYFDSNVAFSIKSKEQLKEEENRALISINETSAEKATKRLKLNEEVEELKRHL